MRKKKRAKRARSTLGWGLGFASEANNKNIYLGPHPPPSQVFPFALTSSSLAILSARSTIEYEKIEGCEQSIIFRLGKFISKLMIIDILIARKQRNNFSFTPPIFSVITTKSTNNNFKRTTALHFPAGLFCRVQGAGCRLKFNYN